MPRRARMYLPDHPYHIVQRGNNREVYFIEPENYQFYLELWQECAGRYGVAVHAYCLMTNHIHVLVTPGEEESVSRAMKVIGSRYVKYINKKYKRTGTLWEGWDRSSLVQSNSYFLVCSRYIELNLVAAQMIKPPVEYRWSSYGENAWGDTGWMTPHTEYLALGTTLDNGARAYRDLFQNQIAAGNVHLIRQAAHYCQPVADERFRVQIEQKYRIKLGKISRGRPIKNRTDFIKI